MNKEDFSKIAYTQNDLNNPVEIYRGGCITEIGEMRIEGECVITASWHPNLTIRFVFNSSFFHTEFDKETLLYLKDWDHLVRAHIDIVKFTIKDNQGTSSLVGKLAPQGFLFPAENRILRAVHFHVVNLNNISLYEADSNGGFSEVGSLDLLCDDWKFTIQRYAYDDRIYEKLEHFNGSAITHTVRVERLTPYTGDVYESISEVSDFLTHFLSFHRGLWTSVCLPIGVNVENQVLLRGLYGSRIDFWQSIPDQSYTKNSHDLSRTIGEFWRKWKSEEWHDALKMIIHWYIESNTLSGGFQGSIVQQQAAFERFAWTLKENNLAFDELSDAKFNDLPAVKKISDTLKWAEIPDTISPHSRHIIAYFENKQKVISGSEILVEIRNGLVHPKPSRREMLNDVSQGMLSEVHNVGQSYLRLLIGKIIGMSPMIIEFPKYKLKSQS